MHCDMCGEEAPLLVAEIEGVDLNVCRKCAKYGTVKKKVSSGEEKSKKPQAKKKKAPAKKEKTFIVVEDYAKRIKNARESMELRQDQFSRKLNEKASVITKLENGRMKPPIDLARKLEKILHISLVEEIEEDEDDTQDTQGTSSGSQKGDKNVTVGDMIHVKK